MRRRPFSNVCCLAVLLGAALCEASFLGPGKYCGVVIFDRWGGCTLYSGIYVMYVSEKTKDGLREYAGQAVQIDAKDVYQPMNPGDGRIGRFEYLGAAPRNRNWVALDGIHLESSVKASGDGRAIATITIQNKGTEPIKLFSQELALTLLMEHDPTERSWSPSDGPSTALITRQSFESGGSEPRWEGQGVAHGKPYSWTIEKETALPHEFALAPEERRHINVRLNLPDGQYDFLCGYGGGVHAGMCLASNLVAFDVKDGKAKVVEIEGRQHAQLSNAPARQSEQMDSREPFALEVAFCPLPNGGTSHQWRLRNISDGSIWCPWRNGAGARGYSFTHYGYKVRSKGEWTTKQERPDHRRYAHGFVEIEKDRGSLFSASNTTIRQFPGMRSLCGYGAGLMRRNKR